MARILSVSYDEELLYTRRLLLESRGYCVTSALGWRKASIVASKADSIFSSLAIRYRKPTNKR